MDWRTNKAEFAKYVTGEMRLMKGDVDILSVSVDKDADMFEDRFKIWVCATKGRAATGLCLPIFVSNNMIQRAPASTCIVTLYGIAVDGYEYYTGLAPSA